MQKFCCSGQCPDSSIFALRLLRHAKKYTDEIITYNWIYRGGNLKEHFNKIVGIALAVAGIVIVYNPVIKPSMTHFFTKLGRYPGSSVAAMALIAIGIYLFFRKESPDE